MINFRLYCITDRTQTGKRSVEDVIESACKAGVRAIQLRERDLSPAALYDLALRIRAITGKYKTLLFINDRVDICQAVDADGVHLRETSIPVIEARRLLSRDRLIGASVHSIRRAKQAEKEGADFLTLGTIFPTQSKPDLKISAGIEKIKIISQQVKIPVFAIGGITPSRVKQCLESGAHGIAAISAIMQSDDLYGTIKQFKKYLNGL